MEEKSRIDWKQGDIAAIKPGWHRFGVLFRVLGPAIFLKQWWVPVADPDEEDPDFHKEAGLELLEPRDNYIPTSLRTHYENEMIPEPRELKYGIGQLDASEPDAAIGMWAGLNPSLMEMLEIVGRDNNSVLVKFDIDGTNPIIYRWDTSGVWQKVNKNEPQKVYLET
jgi:hypothetical protein